ncbi:glycosyl hydrolase [Bifidobacterium boum]|uniref:GH25 family lysozyme n=1 Tax=Bifidobacterium boum TaxID=78343 RepID=UPI001F47CA4D|nr:GH25 family lysozyme [Bifidobacterium boum]MCF2562471.1 glycosyl hydrolase [Bifidobacterium boum]
MKGIIRRILGCVIAVPLAALPLMMEYSATTTDTQDIHDQAADISGVAESRTLANGLSSTGTGEATMPENPNIALPQRVSSKVTNESTVISPQLAISSSGVVRNLRNGAVVTDPKIVGTTDKAPDPLARTGGRAFIPVSVAEVREAISDSDEKTRQQGATVETIAFSGNKYGAHWGEYNGSSAFFGRKTVKNGNTKSTVDVLFAQQAKRIVDVSEHQKTINWEAAKADGVQGAIIRIGYGWGNGFDKYAVRNINECKRLGIPFGVYLYSYAYDANTAAKEGRNMANLLKEAGISPHDMRLPVYYDLEKWVWTGHTPPSDPNVNNAIVDAWWREMQSAGYTNLAVYSYTSYLNSALNNTNIHAKTKWVAQYGSNMAYTAFPTNERAWQYSDCGSINGISGCVDMNAYGNKNPAGDPLQDYQVKGAMGQEWQSIGAGNSVIGWPIAEEVCNWTAGNVNCYQNFEHGAISWTPSTGAHYTAGQLREKWRMTGFESGRLGYPIADEQRRTGDWWSQSFQHGDIWTRGTENKFIVLDSMRKAFNANGGFKSLGGPVADERSMGGGWWRQRFQNGDVWCNGSGRFFVVKFDLRDSWDSHGGFPRVGAPVANEESMGGGYWRQRFQYGDVWTRNGSREKYVVLLSLRDSYYANGGFKSLGGPVADERSMGGGWWRQRFQNGDVVVH